MNRNELLEHYFSRSAADKFILGFNYYGIVHAVIVEPEMAKRFFIYEKATGNRPAAIRFRPRTMDKFELLYSGLDMKIERTDELKARAVKGNNGDKFEQAIFERFGQVWSGHNSTPYNVAGDIEIDGLQYQLKFEQATIITENDVEGH